MTLKHTTIFRLIFVIIIMTKSLQINVEKYSRINPFEGLVWFKTSSVSRVINYIKFSVLLLNFTLRLNHVAILNQHYFKKMTFLPLKNNN